MVWTLIRALGPVGASVPATDASSRVFAAKRLRLGSRIASRQHQNVLCQEIGREGIDTLQLALRRQMARGLAVLDLERQCVTAANEVGADMVLLKFAALRRLGFVTVSTRGTQDLDILVEEPKLGQVSDALTAAGLVLVEKTVPRHHPAVLQAPSGVNVELHTHLPHVRVGTSGQFATVETLRDARLLDSVEGAGDHLLVAGRELLAAHLIAHALVTHAYAPDAYPPLRILSDAIDLGFGHEPTLLEGAHRWIGTDVPARDVHSLAELANECAAGRVEELLSGDSGAAVLLRHLLASVIDPGYRRRLRVARLGQLLNEDGPVETALHLGRAIRRNFGRLVGFGRE